MIKDFKQFLIRGNLVELAVAVVIGLAFAAVVTALVRDLITPIIAAIIGKHEFSALTFTINNSMFKYSDFLNALITFASTAAAVFFFVVKPYNAFVQRARREPTPDPTTEEVPRMPERDPHRRPPVRLLHVRGRLGGLTTPQGQDQRRFDARANAQLNCCVGRFRPPFHD